MRERGVHGAAAGRAAVVVLFATALAMALASAPWAEKLAAVAGGEPARHRAAVEGQPRAAGTPTLPEATLPPGQGGAREALSDRHGEGAYPASRHAMTGMPMGMPMVTEVPAPGREAEGKAGLVERQGGRIPPQLVLRDEDGRAVRFGDLTGTPVVLSPVYFRCEHICPQVLVGLARLTRAMTLRPGRDYRLVTVSFDAEDTPAGARQMRQDYTAAAGGVAPGGWVFLTGDEANLAALMGAAGISLQRVAHGFIHPAVLLILAPGGTIARYVQVSKYDYGLAYPVAFRAAEIDGALRAAAAGTTPAAGPAAAVLYCFPQEPTGQAIFFRAMAVAGGLTLAGLAGLFVWLQHSRRSRPEEGT
jgi:protein SCO1